MRRLIWLPIAGFLLVAGAAAAAAAPSVLHQVQAVLPAADGSPSPSTAPSTVQRPDGLGPDGVLTKVLADLVAKGTITQAQADAISSALQTEIDDRRTAAQQQRQLMMTLYQKLQSQGYLTQADVDSILPADNPFRVAFDSIAQNGKVTLQQLQQFMPFGGKFMGGPGFGPMGPGFGRHMWGWPGITDQNPSPSATP